MAKAKLAEQAERYDRHPQTAMADLVLLSGADQLIATTMSTFSYATHARGLSRPYYMTFRDPRRGDMCAAAAGPEAGLLALGAMHDGCTVTDADARALDADGRVIPGLYAAGNDMASIMGGNYPGAGITLGPALTFGYIAGRHLAESGVTLPVDGGFLAG